MVAFRAASPDDLPAIIAMLSDDPLGQSREDASDPPNPAYLSAFQAIVDDANQLLAVADEGGAVGCMQISFIPGLSRLGMWRGQIESVRIATSHRGEGLGRKFIEWAIAQCREQGCGLVQLTTDNTRADALKFYQSLGFAGSHTGMKLSLG